MLDTNDVAIEHAKVEAYIAEMEKLTEEALAGIKAIDEDASLYPQKKDEKKKILREAATPGLANRHASIAAAREKLESNEKYWQSTPFLLSRQAVANSSEYNVINGMDNHTLKLTFEHAKETGNHGRTYQAFAVAQSRGLKDFNLAGIDFPEAQAGLAALEAARAGDSYAKGLCASIWGHNAVTEKMHYYRDKTLLRRTGDK